MKIYFFCLKKRPIFAAKFSFTFSKELYGL